MAEDLPQKDPNKDFEKLFKRFKAGEQLSPQERGQVIRKLFDQSLSSQEHLKSLSKSEIAKAIGDMYQYDYAHFCNQMSNPAFRHLLHENCSQEQKEQMARDATNDKLRDMILQRSRDRNIRDFLKPEASDKERSITLGMNRAASGVDGFETPAEKIRRLIKERGGQPHPDAKGHKSQGRGRDFGMER